MDLKFITYLTQSNLFGPGTTIKLIIYVFFVYSQALTLSSKLPNNIGLSMLSQNKNKQIQTRGIYIGI